MIEGDLNTDWPGTNSEQECMGCLSTPAQSAKLDELEDSATGCGPPALRTPWLPCLAIDQVELRYMILYYMHLYEPIYTRSQVTRDWVAERICRGALSE